MDIVVSKNVEANTDGETKEFSVGASASAVMVGVEVKGTVSIEPEPKK